MLFLLTWYYVIQFDHGRFFMYSTIEIFVSSLYTYKLYALMPNKLYFDKENPNEVSDFKFYERLMFLEIGI